MATRNEETLELLVTALERNHGDIAQACYGLGTSTGWLRKWMRDDPKIEAAIKDAVESGSYSIESEMIRRAVEGVDENVYFKETLLETRKKYSDSLLVKLVEGRRKEVFGKQVDINQTITLKHLSDDELNTKIDMLAQRLGMTLALPAPEDAVFELVSENEPETANSVLDDLL